MLIPSGVLVVGVRTSHLGFRTLLFGALAVSSADRIHTRDLSLFILPNIDFSVFSPVNTDFFPYWLHNFGWNTGFWALAYFAQTPVMNQKHYKEVHKNAHVLWIKSIGQSFTILEGISIYASLNKKHLQVHVQFSLSSRRAIDLILTSNYAHSSSFSCDFVWVW